MGDSDDTTATDTAAAERLIDKLRDFATTLDAAEQTALAALIAPGVALAHGDEEVEGFGVSWSDASLPEYLGEVVRRRELRVQGW